MQSSCIIIYCIIVWCCEGVTVFSYLPDVNFVYNFARCISSPFPFIRLCFNFVLVSFLLRCLLNPFIIMLVVLQMDSLYIYFAKMKFVLWKLIILWLLCNNWSVSFGPQARLEFSSSLASFFALEFPSPQALEVPRTCRHFNHL